MKSPTLKQRFQYWFDNYMSQGAGALIAGLAVISVAIISFAALLLVAAGRLLAPEGAEPPGFVEAFWLSLMRTLDAGTMGGDAGWGFRVLMLLVTIGGIFIVSTLIGVLSNGLEERLEELRKGRSLVLESDHTLILGWSPQIFTVISELTLANESRKSGAVIVVLAEQDKLEMEDAIQERVPDTKNTRVICRSGSPIDLNDLEIGSPHTARSIIILAEGDDPDTRVIQATLAVTNHPRRKAGAYHIVTEIRNPRNMEVARLLGVHDVVQPILSSDVIARLVAQTSRQSGLSVVYTELLNFGGDEIYFKKFPELTGKTYGAALSAFETSALMGLRSADGEIHLTPPAETVIQPGDSVFVIAADDDKILLDGKSELDEAAIVSAKKSAATKPERALILGWDGCAPTIVRELDNYVPKGSLLTVAADAPGIEEQIRSAAKQLKRQKVEIKIADIRSRDFLDALQVSEYDHVIVLAYSHLPPQDADAITLVTLLHLRDIAEKDETPFSIISEMLDARNRDLAEAAKVDDFIVSRHLISLMMAQISEDKDLKSIFDNLFSAEGSEIYLKPATDYVKVGQPVNFYTVVEAARRRGETALGYRLMSQSHDAQLSHGVHTNPKKSEELVFSSQDKVIVLAE